MWFEGAPCPFFEKADWLHEHTNSIECDRCSVVLGDLSADGIAHIRWNNRPLCPNPTATEHDRITPDPGNGMAKS